MNKFIKNNILIEKEGSHISGGCKMIQVLDVDNHQYHIKKLYKPFSGGDKASWSQHYVHRRYKLADLVTVLDILNIEINEKQA